MPERRRGAEVEHGMEGRENEGEESQGRRVRECRRGQRSECTCRPYADSTEHMFHLRGQQ